MVDGFVFRGASIEAKLAGGVFPDAAPQCGHFFRGQVQKGFPSQRDGLRVLRGYYLPQLTQNERCVSDIGGNAGNSGSHGFNQNHGVCLGNRSDGQDVEEWVDFLRLTLNAQPVKSGGIR